MSSGDSLSSVPQLSRTSLPHCNLSSTRIQKPNFDYAIDRPMTPISTERDTYVSPDSRLRTESEEFGFVELQKMIVFRTQLLWDERNFLGRALCLGLILGLVIAIAIPS